MSGIAFREFNSSLSERLTCSLQYFSAKMYPDETASLASSMPVQIVSTEKKNPGGFTVLVYAPPEFMVQDAYGSPVKKQEGRGEDGLSAAKRIKLRWQLRSLVDADLVVNGIVDPDAHVLISFSVGLSRSENLLESMEKGLAGTQLAVVEAKKEVRLATIVAVIALILSVPPIIDLAVNAWIRHSHKASDHQGSASPSGASGHESPKAESK